MIETQQSLLTELDRLQIEAHSSRHVRVPKEFHGETYVPSRDRDRLVGLMDRVHTALKDGRRWSLSELKQVCGGSEASVSARIRDLKDVRWGGNYAGVGRKIRVRETGHDIEKEYVGNGLWNYWMIERECEL